MSSFTFYDGPVPHVTAAMDVLLHLFNQIEAHASSSNTPIDILISAPLADMFPFPLQVFIASPKKMPVLLPLELIPILLTSFILFILHYASLSSSSAIPAQAERAKMTKPAGQLALLDVLRKKSTPSKLLFHFLFWGAHLGTFAYGCFYTIEKTQIRPIRAVDIHYKEPGGITGHVMLLFGCFVRDTPESFSPFAGKDYYEHCLGYLGWRWELVAGGLYLLERLYREVRAARDTKITRVVRHPYDVVEIQFAKPSFKYKPGQWLFLQMPSISRYQWHPFTITSCPLDPYVSVHVRQIGDFTRALGDAVGAGPAQAKFYEDGDGDPTALYQVALEKGQQMPLLRIDGPYGAPAEDVFDNEIAILIGAGIGVTPWASILKNIWHLRNGCSSPTRLRRVEFFWICKDTTSFEWFQSLLQSLEDRNGEGPAETHGSSTQEFLRIHTYLTQKLDNDTAQNVALNTVRADFDPLTKLKAGTNFGRPNFPKFLQHMRDGITSGTYLRGLEGTLQTKVGVYFCGPSIAAREIKSAYQP
ncbi:hypothetical protein DL764_008580 [Monosporascus ibericus]|uniref:FAD-binding FR-type domain-containing protein n=1 Tax=Monosporascus ibericus TaxID=155417 RepID=A0A4Q4T052_9PEZI|nr:hypothetical protein DL764_008580 [Monosporascus ibericus]